MKTRRILSALLTVAVLLSTFLFVAPVSAEAAAYYVDQSNGSDSNAGTEAAPLASLNAAASKMMAEGGTVYIIGTYSVPAGKSINNTSGKLIVEGAGSDAVLTCPQSAGIYLGGEVEFRNITVSPGLYAHINTKGEKITMGQGSKFSGGMLHVGPLDSGTTSSEHLVIDGGSISVAASIGGAYLTNSSLGISGNVYVDVLSGSLGTLKLEQDGWNESHAKVTIGGDVKVKVGATGSIGAMSNGGRAAVVQGYLHVIVENGGKMPAYVMTNFVHKDTVYRVNVENPACGTVNHTDKTGVFAFEPVDGYLAKLTMPDGTVRYAGSGAEIALPAGDTTVTFTQEKQLADKTVNITLEPATPGETEFPVSVDKADQYDVTVESVSPDHSVVGYAVPYIYTVRIAPKGDYVFPASFAFTINGSSSYRLMGKTETPDSISFVYQMEETARDESRYMISYVGGIGVVGTAPLKEFVDPGTVIAVGDAYFSQGGYAFDGYTTNGTDLYQPGDSYTVNSDVTFTAVWRKMIPYTVVFADGGATGGTAPSSLETYENTYVKVPENTYAKIGYSFKYWEADGKTYLPGDLLFVEDANVTLTAVWEASADAGTIVYVDAENGLSSNDGLSPETPVQTINDAYTAAGDGNLTVVVMGALNLPSEMPAFSHHVTVTGYNGGAQLNLKSSLSFSSDTTVENIKINAQKDSYIATNGNKTVLGPNLENVGAEYDVVDGGVGVSVELIDTTIQPGVSIRNYYFGGADQPGGKVIPGNGVVTVNGGSIGTFDLSPKGSGSIGFGDKYVAAHINGGSIKEFTVSKALESAVSTYVIFSNGTIPEIGTSIMNKLIEGATNAYIIDSGVGGTISINENFVTRGRVSAATNVGGNVYQYQLNNGNYAKRSASLNITLVALQSNPSQSYNKYAINKVRYGAPLTGALEATVESPTGGAEAFSISAQSSNTSCKIQLSGWTPELQGGKFSYETQYSVNLLITANEDSFFADRQLPTVTVNGTSADVVLNRDGTLSATYTFPGKTGYAPTLNVSFDSGSPSVTEGVPADMKWEHMAGQSLPYGITMTNLGYRFVGWKCSADGKVYRGGETYYFTSNSDVTFTAEWQQRGSWELPNVIILYDLTMYASDTGRNPKFESSDAPILVENAFSTLEHEIGGSKSTKKTEYDHEQVFALTSDGGDKPMMFNNFSLEKAKADPTEYTHVTMVYYYDSKNEAAVGDHGSLTVGSFTLSDGKVSNWFGKAVESKETVVANQWATMTFDLTDTIANIEVPEKSVYHQFHMYPIGKKTCAELKGDTLYMKAMYFSKQPTVK